jgi:archaemetzincin
LRIIIMRFPVDFESTGEREILRLRNQLEARFHTKVNVSGLDIDHRAFLDLRRNQYSSSAIIKQLEQYLPGAPVKILAVAGFDLFNPIVTFVFGEARLNGQCAVVSSYRLDNKLYGLPDNPALLQERLLKEATHELGHTYGLLHCHNPECVMKSSTYVEEIDFKSSRFCYKCLEKLGNGSGLPENGRLTSQVPGGVPVREKARTFV